MKLKCIFQISLVKVKVKKQNLQHFSYAFIIFSGCKCFVANDFCMKWQAVKKVIILKLKKPLKLLSIKSKKNFLLLSFIFCLLLFSERNEVFVSHFSFVTTYLLCIHHVKLNRLLNICSFCNCFLIDYFIVCLLLFPFFILAVEIPYKCWKYISSTISNKYMYTSEHRPTHINTCRYYEGC